MARRTPPSCDFYFDDFTAGTYYLSAIEVGMYMRSICFQWNNDGLPNDPEKLAKIMGVTTDEFAQHWPAVRDKFSSDGNGSLFNERLKAEKDKKLGVSEVRAEVGRKGGLAKAKQLLSKRGSKKVAKGSRKTEVGRRKTEDGSGTLEGGSGKVDPDVQAVVEHYQTFHPRARPDDKVRKLVAARLAGGFSVDDIKQAIDGCHKSPFHLGQNDSGREYLKLGLIVRDSEQVTGFIELATGEASGKGRAKNQDVFERMMRRFADE